METRCASAYSRGRAVVVMNEVPIMIDALADACRSLPERAGVQAVECLLVQTEQLLRRAPAVPAEAMQHLAAARQSLASHDPALARVELSEALTVLTTTVSLERPR